MQEQQLIHQLAAFGLGRIESHIYLHLLGKQPQTILEIARELSLPRTSIYDNSLKLIEKGLVEKVVTYKSQKLKAFPLSILQGKIEKEQAKVTQLQEKLVSLEEQLAHPLMPAFATEVRYYHGKQGLQQMMFNSLSAKKETIGYSQFGRVDVVGEKFAKWHGEEFVKKKLIDRVITNPVKEMLQYVIDPAMKWNRDIFQQTRLLPRERLYVSGDTTIFNNIFQATYWKQGEVVGVEIENEEFVKTQKSIFEEMWKLAQPLEAYLKKVAKEEE